MSVRESYNGNTFALGANECAFDSHFPHLNNNYFGCCVLSDGVQKVHKRSGIQYKPKIVNVTHIEYNYSFYVGSNILFFIYYLKQYMSGGLKFIYILEFLLYVCIYYFDLCLNGQIDLNTKYYYPWYEPDRDLKIQALTTQIIVQQVFFIIIISFLCRIVYEVVNGMKKPDSPEQERRRYLIYRIVKTIILFVVSFGGTYILIRQVVSYRADYYVSVIFYNTVWQLLTDGIYAHVLHGTGGVCTLVGFCFFVMYLIYTTGKKEDT